jgi:GNAT superfamily N-acetyltransferase
VSLLHLYARPALDKPPEVVVQALVVDADCRQGGVGKAMMEAAEGWARDHGFRSVALTSHISREGAHAFYAALGYRIVATSHLLRKELD